MFIFHFVINDVSGRFNLLKLNSDQLLSRLDSGRLVIVLLKGGRRVHHVVAANVLDAGGFVEHASVVLIDLLPLYATLLSYLLYLLLRVGL